MGGPYTVAFHPTAHKELASLPSPIQRRVLARLTALSNDPRPHDVKKLKGSANQYRIPVGVYRVIYEIHDTTRLVQALHIRHRRDAYRP
jgi:mRNA interferase RelE/StbE